MPGEPQSGWGFAGSGLHEAQQQPQGVAVGGDRARADPTLEDVSIKFKGARWALLKKPTNLSDEQAATLRKLKRRGGDVWRAYTLKEAFRAIFAGDLDPDAVAELIDRWISRASQCIDSDAFVKTSKTIRKHRDGLNAAIRLAINNGRPKASTTSYASSSAEPEASTAPRQPSPWPCSPADPSPCNYHTSAPTITENDPHSCRESPKTAGDTGWT